MARHVLRPRWLAGPAYLLTGLPGCFVGIQVGDPVGNVVVYEDSGRRQCDAADVGLPPQQSGLKLIRAGLDVLRSGCGTVTGVAFPAVCGAPTGEILLHEIRAVSLDEAERQGFQVADALRNDQGRGYEWVDCETRTIQPD